MAAADTYDPLPDGEVADVPGTSSSARLGKRAARGAGVGLVLWAGVYVCGNWPNVPSEAPGLRRRQESPVALVEDMEDRVSYTTSCYGFTGGTCFSTGCNANRSATCVDGKCLCMAKSGTCSNAQGQCESGKYKQIADGIFIDNAYWSDQRLYMQTFSVFTQLKVTAWRFMLGDEAKWDIHEVPGEIHGKKMYLLSSKRWPSWVATMRATVGTAFSPFGLFGLNLDHTTAPWEPQGLNVHICQVTKEGFGDAVQIMSPGTLSTAGLVSRAYVHYGSWLVYGWSMTSDPGTGGYWVPSSHIPDLQAC
eukprot:TRINITY_DN37197_c0_g1_i1.p2 TRINITY_DN37197_c0_g1~~TRINITY_DN37197_c0_g1_i1.p2  ORF type:complete len:331 (-),score=55.58 TRINITY_DN37197_c0_g1_i1:127-1044(-)